VHNNNDANQSNDSRMYYGEYQIQRHFEGIGLVLTGGIVGIYTDIRAKLYNNADYTSKNLSGYMQLDYKVFNRLNISAGMRYEQNVLNSPDTIHILPTQYKVIPNGETREAKPVYRLGVNYQVSTATYVRASYGQGYRYPSVAEKFINTAFGGNYTVRPNPDLVSETGWTEEVGVKQGFKLWGWQGFVDLTAFVSEYHNMMEFGVAGFDPTTFGFYFQSRNTGDTHISGQEISIAGQGKVGGGTLSILAGYTHIDPKYKQYDKDTLTHGNYPYEKNVLKYRYRHIVKWDSEYNYKKFTGGLSVLYNSNIEAIDYIFFSLPGMSTFLPAHNKGFTVLDIRASYQLSKHLKITGICGNILNSEYTVRPALLEAPRNYTVRLDWKL
jgi:iron complex outermembrane receptor protein